MDDPCVRRRGAWHYLLIAADIAHCSAFYNTEHLITPLPGMGEPRKPDRNCGTLQAAIPILRIIPGLPAGRNPVNPGGFHGRQTPFCPSWPSMSRLAEAPCHGVEQMTPGR